MKKTVVTWPSRPHSRYINGRLNTAYVGPKNGRELKSDSKQESLKDIIKHAYQKEEYETKVFGYKKTTNMLTFCGDPEYCKIHSDHEIFTRAELSQGVISEHNEPILHKLRSYNNIPNADGTFKRVKNTDFSMGLTKKELEESSNSIAQQISNEDWNFIKEFQEKYIDINDNSPSSVRGEKVKMKVLKFLESESDIALKTREFLGDDMPLEQFSGLITGNINAMTKSSKWPMENSINRVINTTFDNDMNRKRYVASVMFFGGRCCYCNRALGDALQATGEHITPVSPEKEEDPIGSTRYGNMVLACRHCNNKRSNHELTEWIRTTNLIEKDQKPMVLGRIKAFRDFCLYSEYSPEETSLIKNKIQEVRDYIKENPNPKKDEIIKRKIQEKIAITIQSLREEME